MDNKNSNIAFMTGLLEELLTPLKIIDTTGWWKVEQDIKNGDAYK